MRIDFVSDIACPWCAVGLASLERAISNLNGAVPIELHFQPFELNPDMPPEGEDLVEHIGHKYGSSPQQVAAAQARLKERGAAVGFEFGRRERVWNTFDAHRLLYWAGLQGRQLELKRALLRAYHGLGLNPGDAQVLAQSAAEAGLDRQQAAEVIASGRYADEVRRQESLYRRMGIDSVPSVIIDGRHLVQGGQPPEVFEDALRRLATSSAES